MKEKAVIYVFIGDGLGVPGLPHEMTQEWANANGVGALLTQAIADGVYVEKKAVEKAGKDK